MSFPLTSLLCATIRQYVSGVSARAIFTRTSISLRASIAPKYVACKHLHSSTIHSIKMAISSATNVTQQVIINNTQKSKNHSAIVPDFAESCSHPQGDGLYILPMGGCGEIGMNANLYYHKGAWLMVDLGNMMSDHVGDSIDYIVPDMSFIVERCEKLAGLVITHGHEDHIGFFTVLCYYPSCLFFLFLSVAFHVIFYLKYIRIF